MKSKPSNKFYLTKTEGDFIQKALVIWWHTDESNNLSKLNQMFENDWKVVCSSPLGIYNLVILEKQE